MNSLDAWMPEYQFSEFHSLRIDAPVDRVWEAVKLVTPEEIGVLGFLMAIRSLPGKLMGRKARLFPAGTPLLDIAVSGNFVVLEERPPNAIVLGMAGQFWKPDGGPRGLVRSTEGFLEFREPGFVRATINFEIEAGRISTETRIQALCESSKRKFGFYWRLIQPGRGWIRIGWLKAIRRRAEAATAAATP